MNCIQQPLSKCFSSIGRFVGRHPWYFVAIPFILSIILSTGVMRIDVRKKVEYLYSPINSKILQNKQRVIELFPMNTSKYFDLGRVPDAAMYTIVLVRAQDGGSVLRSEIMREIMEIDSGIRGLEVEIDGKNMTYEDVCAKKREQCMKNEVKALADKIHAYERSKKKNKKLEIRYPVYINEATYEFTFYGQFVGGVEQDYEGNAQSAEAIRLFYFMDDSDKEHFGRATKWETAVSNMLEKTEGRNITFTWFSKTSYAIETSKVTRKISLSLVISLVVMVVFMFVVTMSRQWTQSKPWMSLAFVLCVLLAMASGLGLGMYCGIKFATIIIFDLFLLLGIGMNDTFVLVSNWRRTDRKDTVDNRLAETYSASFVPVTATYLIVLISFCIGLTIPFRAAQMFCAYSALTSTFFYLYEISFLGGCLAIAGYREINDRHPIICVSVSAKSKKAGVRGCFEEDSSKPAVNYFISSLFGRSYVSVITNMWSRCVITLLFLAYIVVAVLQCTKLQITSGVTDIFPKDCHIVSYYGLHYKYFTRYPHRIQLVVDTPVDYSTPEVQQQVEDLLESFGNSTFIESKLTGCWLRIYNKLKNGRLSFMLRPLDFVPGVASVLRLQVLADFATDVIIDVNETSIEAMRCAVHSFDINSAEKESGLLDEVERITSQSKLPVIFSSMLFPSYDIHRIIRSIVLWTIPVMAGAALVSFTLLVPNLIGIFGATLSGVSTQVGVMGFLSLWGVKVNPFFVVMVVMIVGLSVNYACHFTYAYVTSREETHFGRTLLALKYHGPIVLQNTIILLVACAFLMLVGNLLLEIFYKIIFLVFVFGALHTLLFLPALYFTLESVLRSSKGFSPDAAREMGEVRNSERIGLKGGTDI